MQGVRVKHVLSTLKCTDKQAGGLHAGTTNTLAPSH